MTKISAAILATILGTVAHATPILTFEDFINPNPDIKMSSSGGSGTYKSVTYTHNILDNGFSPTGHKVLDADIYISLSDDSRNDPSEYVRIQLDNVLAANKLEVDYSTYHFDVTSSLLQSDGKLTVTLTARDGDFYFRQSKLVVKAEAIAGPTPAPTAVPEPTSMLLAGLGLLGVQRLAKRKQKA